MLFQTSFGPNICSFHQTHIYICEYLNTEKPEETFEKSFSRNLKQQISVFERFENNMKIRDEYSNKNDHEIQHSDPPYSVLECVNG